MVSTICSKDWVGGERWVTIVVVSCGCLYYVAVRRPCRVWSVAALKWRRHSVGERHVKVGLYIVQGSLAGLGGALFSRIMVGTGWSRLWRRSSGKWVGMCS